MPTAPTWLRVLALCAAPLLLVGPALLPGRGLAPADPAVARAAREVQALRDGALAELSRGAIPTWTPSRGLGMPLAAAGPAGPWDPLGWAGRALPGERGRAGAAALALLLAGAGMDRFLARRGLQPGPRLVGALALQTSGCAAVAVAGPGAAAALAWLPVALAGVEGVRAGSRLGGPIATAAVGAAFLGGAPRAGAAVVLAALGCALGAALESPRSTRSARRALLAAAFVLLGVGAASLELVPAAEAWRGSDAPPVAAVAAGAPALSPWDLVAPSPRGAPGAAWLGPAVLGLALAGVAGSTRRALPPLCLALLGAGAAGGAEPLARAAALLPGGPADGALLLALGAAWLAGLGTEALVERAPRAAPGLLAAGFGALAAGLATQGVAAAEPERLADAGLAGLAPAAPRLIGSGAAVVAAAMAGLVLSRGPHQGGAPRWKLVLATALVLALACSPLAARAPELFPPALSLGLAVAALTLLGHAEEGRRAVWLPLAAALAVEGAAGFRGSLGVGDAAPGPSAAAVALAEAAGPGRVLRLDALAGRACAVSATDVVAAGGRDLTGDAAFPPRELARLCDGLRDAGDEVLQSPLLDLARVGAVLAPRALAGPGFAEAWSGAGGVVLRRTALPPAARVVADLEGDEAERALVPAELVLARPRAARIDARVEARQPSWLVVDEQHDAGWKAAVNGSDAPVRRAAGGRLAVRLPAARVGVRLKHEPWSLRIGASAAVLALAGAGLLAWAARREAGAP